MDLGDVNEAATETYGAIHRAADIDEGSRAAALGSGAVFRVLGRVSREEALPGEPHEGLAGQVKLEAASGRVYTIPPTAPMLLLAQE